MILYHGTKQANLTELKANKALFGEGLVYLSSRRENTFPYLSNAIEKFFKDNNLKHEGAFHEWFSYGFRDGKIEFQEYYPNALYETFNGVSGYVYSTNLENVQRKNNFPFVFTSNKDVKLEHCEFIKNAYEEILKMNKEGIVNIKYYKNNTPADLEWIQKTIKKEYALYPDIPDYRTFLEAKFPFVQNKTKDLEK